MGSNCICPERNHWEEGALSWGLVSQNADGKKVEGTPSAFRYFAQKIWPGADDCGARHFGLLEHFNNLFCKK
jgi:hypothetical protein